MSINIVNLFLKNDTHTQSTLKFCGVSLYQLHFIAQEIYRRDDFISLYWPITDALVWQTPDLHSIVSVLGEKKKVWVHP